MVKSNILQMGMRYKQFFSPNIDKARGTMGLDDAVADITNFRHVLGLISRCVPDKENFQVGLNNCETCLWYSREITCLEDLTKPKQVIRYFLQELPLDLRPFAIGINPKGFSDENYVTELETYLNGLGKTLYTIKSDESTVNKLLILTVGSYNIAIRNLKRD
nr:hypothetical protein [Nanoarchaeum sp.]